MKSATTNLTSMLFLQVRSYDVIKTIIICLGNNVGNNLIIIITRLAPTCHWRSTEAASPTASSFSTFLFESSSVDPTPSSSLKIFKTTKSSPSNFCPVRNFFRCSTGYTLKEKIPLHICFFYQLFRLNQISRIILANFP